MQGIKDTLQKNRNKIVYALVLITLFLALAEWALLPERVGLVYSNGALSGFTDKNAAILAHIAIGVGFSGLFWKWPREITYLVGAVLGILLELGVLLTNLGYV